MQELDSYLNLGQERTVLRVRGRKANWNVLCTLMSVRVLWECLAYTM